MAGRTPSRATTSESPPADDASASPLWPLVVILGEIAERVTRRHADEHAHRGHGTSDVNGDDTTRQGGMPGAR